MDELIFQREFLRVAEAQREAPAIVDLGTGRRSTFGQHAKRVLRLGHALREHLGVGPADRFSVLLGNRHEYCELWHAGLSGFGVITPINVRARPEDLHFVLEDSGSTVVFVDETFAGTIADLRDRLPLLRTVVRVGGSHIPGDADYEDLLAAGAPEAPPASHESDIAVLMYTGGTTGTPKGVVLDQRGVVLNWHRIDEAIRPTQGWSMLQIVPMFHVGSFVSLLLTHLSGGAIVFQPRWDPGAALDAIEEHQLSALGLVPTMAAQLLDHPNFRRERLASIRYFGYGAAPMPIGLLRRLIDTLPKEAAIAQGYGLTETSGLVTLLGDADHRGLDPDVLRSVGRRMCGYELSIRDAAGEALSVGEIGEVCLQSGSVLREYWRRPQETEDALREGWFWTGDLGYVDERGYLWLTDRSKDMIISGGENVYSIEVENAIASHPGVSLVAVIGVPHDIWGETVHAVVQPVPGVELTEADVITHARAHLAGYKIPRSVEIRHDALPVSAVGKVLKSQLRAEFVLGHG